jgi:hypothetical protein
MPKLAGVSHLRAIKAFTMAGIIKDAGLSIDKFKKLI